MEKQLAQYTYWLGLACAVIALVMRGFSGLGVWMPQRIVPMTFYKGALLFLVVAIATANLAWLKIQKA
jgi:DMSO/TMAO reductase YedYZ heme-binding membrane subunit